VITAPDISAALADMGVEPGDTLFVHSDVRTSLRVEGARVPDKLSTIAQGLAGAVPEGALVLPTFTYSFTRNEDFDVDASPSTVGALSEWFRGRPGIRRTADPLFSVALHASLGDPADQALLTPGDTDSFGPRSVFARLRELDAKLLCWGTDIQALTFVHHAEQLLSVPYRFMKDFSGVVRSQGNATEVTASYYVRRLERGTEVWLHPLGADLLRDGGARTTTLPDGPELFLTDTGSVLETIRRELDANPDYLLRRGHGA
jgi:aminoglycoside 3-N-acetyltransferase